MQRMSREVDEFKHCPVLVSVQGEYGSLSQADFKHFCLHLWALSEALGQAKLYVFSVDEVLEGFPGPSWAGTNSPSSLPTNELSQSQRC